MSDPTLTSSACGATTTFVAAGNWTAAHSGPLDRLVRAVSSTKKTAGRVAIDVSRIEQLDTLGAWLLERLARCCQFGGQEPVFVGVPNHFKGLLERVHDVTDECCFLAQTAIR